MRCSFCGKENDQDSLYCEYCGSKLESSNNNSKIIIILISIIVFVLCVGGIFLYLNTLTYNTPKKDNETIENKEKDKNQKEVDKDLTDNQDEKDDNLENVSDYILMDSNSRYISKSELYNLTQQELKLARNELYARYGYIFESEDLRLYFTSKSWYTPLVSKKNFNEDVLNDYEKSNRDMIVEYEKEKGFR